jgi:hypothetical protein
VMTRARVQSAARRSRQRGSSEFVCFDSAA